ncbi:DUF5110 domain-containing protein [bacterium]|nr:DUF5110 domain-containing protein [bacterium]
MQKTYVIALAAVFFSLLSFAEGTPAGTEVSTAVKPTPKANPMIIDGVLRLSILNEGCMRVEKGSFHDEPSMFAKKREMDFFDFEIEDKDDQILVKTKKLIFFVDRHRFLGRMDGGNYGVDVPGYGCWHGDNGVPDLEDLGGSIATLDGSWDACKLDEGFMKKEGWCVIDDTKTALVMADGNPKVREYGPLGQDMYVFCYGKDYRLGLEELCDVSGKIPLPPRFAMGSWYSRHAMYTSEDYRNIVKGYEEQGYPLDVLVWDMEWHDRKGNKGLGHCGTLGWTGWTWNRELLPDAEDLLKEMRGKGLHIALNVHPADGIRDTDFCYEEFMQAMGESTEGGRIIPFQDGSKKYMDAYFKYAHDPLEAQGADVWWVDWQQDYLVPYVTGVPGLSHWSWLNKLYYEYTDRPERRGLSLARWGGLGDQKHPVEFSGDTGGTWEELQFQICMTPVSANAGCCYWSHDLGGFFAGEDGEIYARWLQFGAISAVFRLHSCGNIDKRPWFWQDFAQKSARGSFDLRSVLMPYIYTAAEKLYRESLPFMRPLYYDFPEDEQAYVTPQEFLLGDGMLAAPIAEHGRGKSFVSTKVVYFPSDGWAQYFTGESYDKGFSLVSADLYEFPLFVKKGYPLVLGQTGKRMADLPKELTVMIFPTEDDGTGESELYEDDGLSKAYQEGKCARTPFSYQREGCTHFITIGETKGDFEGKYSARPVKVVLRNVASYTAVKFQDQDVQAEFDPEKRTLTVALADTLPGDLVIEASTAEPKDIAAAETKRRQALLDEDDKEGKLLVAGCGLGKTSESAYGYRGRDVYRFFPGGVVEEAVVTKEGSDDTVTLNFKAGSANPVVLPPPDKGKEMKVRFSDLELKY